MCDKWGMCYKEPKSIKVDAKSYQPTKSVKNYKNPKVDSTIMISWCDLRTQGKSEAWEYVKNDSQNLILYSTSA